MGGAAATTGWKVEAPGFIEFGWAGARFELPPDGTNTFVLMLKFCLAAAEVEGVKLALGLNAAAGLNSVTLVDMATVCTTGFEARLL